MNTENDISGFTNHVSSFGLQELLSLTEGRNRVIPSGVRIRRAAWDNDAISARLVQLSYEDYMNQDAHLLAATTGLRRDGLIFVNNVPPTANSITKLVERIGPIYNSFYGSTWDGKSFTSLYSSGWLSRCYSLLMSQETTSVFPGCSI